MPVLPVCALGSSPTVTVLKLTHISVTPLHQSSLLWCSLLFKTLYLCCSKVAPGPCPADHGLSEQGQSWATEEDEENETNKR